MRRLRIGVYDLYWTTLGGGEQVDGTIAQVLARDHDVTLLGPERIDLGAAAERLGLDLSGCRFRKVADDREASAASADYDLFINGTYLSTAINRAPAGWYYVHFPERPRTLRSFADHWVGVAGVRTLRNERLPARLQARQTAFDARVRRVEFRPTYHRYLANSSFTARWVERMWGVDCEVLYPPVRPAASGGEKRPSIINVGRFFDPRFGHSKRQLELVAAFEQADIDGWHMSLAGGCDAASRQYALAVRRMAHGHPIHVHINASGQVVQRMFSEASMYWHAGGLGAHPDRQPHRFEHFGIAVVEAMAAGVVPLVFGAAGPAEIVRHGVEGFHWQSIGELIDLTRRLAASPDELERLRRQAQLRALDFSVDRFDAGLRELVGQLD